MLAVSVPMAQADDQHHPENAQGGAPVTSAPGVGQGRAWKC